MPVTLRRDGSLNDVGNRDNFLGVGDLVIRCVREMFRSEAPSGDERPVVCARSPNPAPFIDSTADPTTYNIYVTATDTFDRFAYQLAHELGHVWLGPENTCGVVEAIAEAVSIEALGRASLVAGQDFGVPAYPAAFGAYARSPLTDAGFLERVPPEVARAAQDGRGEDLRLFLRYARARIDGARATATPPDFDLRTIGAAALRSGSVCWPALTGLALMTTVPRVADDRLRDNLPLNYGAMSAAARSLLRRMGRCCGTGLAVLELPAAGAAERPLFTFTENEVTFGLVECDWPELNPVAARLGGRVKAWSEPDHHVV